ncbi:MAG: HlyD family efflux transporter periplasmic adaptor subunit [Proteobacteria bacterium]|nr:HlyD family efflux transporter periplasmic adaptor subunit [Pseudomonadota bacterium]
MAADSLNALAFSIANDAYPLLRFRQALVFAQHAPSQYELLCVSGLAKPQEDSPYLVWLRRTVPWLAGHVTTAAPTWLARGELDAPPEVSDGWAEWWPEGAWCVPIHGKSGQRLGLIVFLLDEPVQDGLVPILQGLFQTWSYCWSSLSGQGRLKGWRPSRKQLLVALAVLAALLLLPVRQTALAPAEIVSRNAQIISSPIDGVIAQMHVRPNQAVTEGAPLFNLDETTLRTRADVLRKEVAVADAELVAASQRAFDNPQSKGELTVLTGKAQQRRSELSGVLAQLERTQVVAPRSGVAVYSDPNDWLGKPVVTGERILLVADPSQPAMRVQLPVADAIALEVGAPVTLYLTAYPLQPLHGKILETSYQARLNEESVVAYRLLVSIEDGDEAARRLGLHGTAKLYGERVVLGYYLLRRPIAAARAWLGW